MTPLYITAIKRIRRNSTNVSRLMSELCSLEYLKLYSLNFAIALAQIKIVMLAKLVIINFVLHKTQEN